MLQTARLDLIMITPQMIHDLFNSQDDKEIASFFGIDENSLDHYREMHLHGMETHRLSLRFFLLKVKESGATIGECGFHTWNTRHDKAELFYALRKDDDKRKGYTSEALQVILDYGFSEMKLHRVSALTADWNKASLAVLHKFGFTYEGTMRQDYMVDDQYEDSVCYSLLKHEWQSRKLS
ncbi:MAG: GNAT family N-acetyltransferase [Flavobacteriales bacterium]|nr:GNAT family N-acetyltransferase [Flavobacteriales bacterium]